MPNLVPESAAGPPAAADRLRGCAPTTSARRRVVGVDLRTTAARFSKNPVVDKALRHSVRDGMAFSVQVGAGETYFSAFALFLRATAPQVALVSTLPLLLASSAQIFSAWLGNYVGRR